MPFRYYGIYDDTVDYTNYLEFLEETLNISQEEVQIKGTIAESFIKW